MFPRLHPRVDFVEPIEVRIGDDTLNLMSLNLSCGGIRLETNRPLLVGQRVSLKFGTDGGPVQVRQAEVIWSKPFEPISIDGVLPGMGIRFTEVMVDDAQHISTVVDQRLSLLEELPPTTQAEAFATELANELSLEPVAEVIEVEEDDVPAVGPGSLDKSELWRPPDIDEPPVRKKKASLRPLYIVAGASILMGGAGITIGHWATSTPETEAAAQGAVTLVAAEPTVEAADEPTPVPTVIVEPAPVIVFSTQGTRKYKYFDLQGPPRIVLDVYGIDEPTALPSVVAPVSSIRVGRHPDRVRFVLDVTGENLPEYEVTPTQMGIEVRLLH